MSDLFGELRIDRELRKKIFDLCKGQKVILFGDTGAGKSTLINTFFGIAKGSYEAVAEAREDNQAVTKTLGKYEFHCKGKENPDLTFLDTCGFIRINQKISEEDYPDGRVSVSDVIDLLLTGELEPETNLHQINEAIQKQNKGVPVQERRDMNEKVMRLVKEARVQNEKEKMKLEPSLVMVVVDVRFPPQKSYFDEMDKAAHKAGKQVCVIATREDMIRDIDNADKKRKKLTDLIAKGFVRTSSTKPRPLLISQEAFYVSNYLPDRGAKSADTSDPDMTEVDSSGLPPWKQKLLLDAFEKTLN